MSYKDIAQAARDGSLRLRIAACIAQEGKAGDTLQTGALARADSIQWQCCGEPGWGDAWASALASGTVTDPGNDPGVITDGMIRAAVARHLGATDA